MGLPTFNDRLVRRGRGRSVLEGPCSTWRRCDVIVAVIELTRRRMRATKGHMPVCENRRDEVGKSSSRIGPEENRSRPETASSGP